MCKYSINIQHYQTVSHKLFKWVFSLSTVWSKRVCCSKIILKFICTAWVALKTNFSDVHVGKCSFSILQVFLDLLLYSCQWRNSFDDLTLATTVILLPYLIVRLMKLLKKILPLFEIQSRLLHWWQTIPKTVME